VLHELGDPSGVGHIGLSARDGPHHRKLEFRASIPDEVTIVASHHPLSGMRVPVLGHRRVGGAMHVIVRMPDGAPGLVDLRSTSAAATALEPSGALLSIQGLRGLRRLLGSRLPGTGGGDT
jgi:hypothetical protein